jgi:hypothetical protein
MLAVKQHPRGTSIKMEEETLKNSSTAAGVTIIVVEGIASPFKAIANEIGPTVPPVGTAILAPKVTLNLARH